MLLLLLNKVINPLLEERFKLMDVPFLETYVAKHHQRNGILLREHDPGHLKFNVFDYLWCILINRGRQVGVPLSLFPQINKSIDFQDVTFRYLTTRENSVIMVKYPSNEVGVGIIHNNSILIEDDGKLIETSISKLSSSPTLIFPIKDLVKEFILIMISQKRIDDLKQLVLYKEVEVRLVKDMVAGNVKSINGVMIKKGDIDGVIDIILNNYKREVIEYTTKDGKVIKVNTPNITSTIKKRVKNSPFVIKKKTEEILTEFIEKTK